MTLTRDQEFFLEHHLIHFDVGCWEWIGTRKKPQGSNLGGYGVGYQPDIKRHGSMHRWAYRVWKGPIPEGLQIDHLCRNRACVNPSHLEAVTGFVNQQRQACLKTHCPHGHEYTPENTKIKRGRRHCRRCTTLAQGRKNRAAELLSYAMPRRQFLKIRRIFLSQLNHSPTPVQGLLVRGQRVTAATSARFVGLDPGVLGVAVRRPDVADRHARLTHCPAGHPYDEPNTGRCKAGKRYCRECLRLRSRARRGVKASIEQFEQEMTKEAR